MDSFELNKILGAILGTLLFVMGVGFLAEGIYAPITGQGASYDLPEPAGGAATAVAAAPKVPLAELLAKADPHAGADSSKKCQSCHDFTEGGPNKTGPNLYNIVGSKIADVPGFQFSEALTKFSDQTWTYENLDHWLASPKNMAPGTKMTFVGVPDDTERANIIAYLRTLSKNPVPLPAVTAAAPATDAAKPGDAAAPAAGAAAPATDATKPATTTTAPAADAAKPADTAPAAATTTAPAASTMAAPAAAAPTTTTPAATTTAPAATDATTPAK